MGYWHQQGSAHLGVTVVKVVFKCLLMLPLMMNQQCQDSDGFRMGNLAVSTDHIEGTQMAALTVRCQGPKRPLLTLGGEPVFYDAELNRYCSKDKKKVFRRLDE